jgi:hypothetical protein
VREPVVAGAADDLGSEPELDVRRRSKLPNQILRHSDLERRRAGYERHPVCVAREMERHLSRGVRAPEHIDVLTGDTVRIGACPAVEDAGAAERLEYRNPEAAIVRARGEDDRARADMAGLREAGHEPVVVGPETGHALHEHEAGAEDPPLLVGLPGEQAPVIPRGNPR